VARRAFVTPATVKLELSEGDWIEIKAELTYGEQLHLQDMSSHMDADDKYHLDVSDFYINRITAWVVEWSFEDEDGRVNVTTDSVKALRGEIAGEINEALTKYINGLDSKN